MSDHYLVYCLRKLNGARRKDHKVIKTRSMKNFDETAFLADVSRINWDGVVSRPVDINVLVDDWSNLFSMIIDKHAPIKSMRVCEKYCPWINKDLKGLMRKRDKLKKAVVKHNFSSLMESYRKIRNRVNQLNINLKRQYFSDKIIQFQGNMEESWRTIKHLLNKRSKSTNIDLISEKGTEIFTKKEISNVMNKYFCSVARDLAGKIDKSLNPLLSGDYDINPLKSTFTLNSIQVQHVREELGKIKVSKSFRHDNISSYFLKLAFPYIKTSLVLLFNTSIESDLFPDKWKFARITPIFKEGDRACKENYRPISVLPVVARLFEKLIFDQLYNYLNINNLL